MLIFIAVLTMTVIRRADLRQEQIKQLSSLGKSNNLTTSGSSEEGQNYHLALTGDLGSTLLASLSDSYNFTSQIVANEEEIVRLLETDNTEFAVLELSQIVKMAALGADIQAFFPSYTESKSYGLVRSTGAQSPCRSLAYIVGTPSEYYSLFLYSSSNSVLSDDFKRIPVQSPEKALQLVKNGEIDGVLLNTDNKLPTGFKFIKKFKPQTFYYMLVRHQRFQNNTSETFADSAQARLDEASTKLVKILFSLQSRVQDPGKYGLLTNKLRRSTPATLELLNRKLSNRELNYIDQDLNISQYQDLISDILTDWKQSQEYDFSGSNFSEETIKRRIFNADFASACLHTLSIPINTTHPTAPTPTKDDASKNEVDSVATPSPTPSASPQKPSESETTANGPVSDEEIFKDEIEQGLLPDSPAVLPAAPKAPPLPQQNS